MSEIIEQVATAIKDELARQDGYGPFEFVPGTLEVPYLDQGLVDMALVARVAIAAIRDAADQKGINNAYVLMDEALK